MNSQELEMKQVKSDIANIKENVVVEYKDDWRNKVNHVLKTIGYKTKNYQEIRNKSYETLEKRAGCYLDIRLKNMRGRAFEAGKSQTYITNLNKLDVIEEDKRLKEIYIGITFN